MSTNSGLIWAEEAGADVAAVSCRWQAGHPAEIAIETAPWEVVRLTARIGADGLRRLRRRRVPLGPVLDVPARRCIEILVPLGTSNLWPDLPGTRCAAAGRLRCPAPYVTVPVCGLLPGDRVWIVPPAPELPPTTDADALCEAAAGALAHCARPWLPQMSTPRRSGRA